MSDLERTKGNESFRNNEYEEAARCYSKSLAYDHDNAMAFANRAMAYIRMEIFDLAEEDRSGCTAVEVEFHRLYLCQQLLLLPYGKEPVSESGDSLWIA